MILYHDSRNPIYRMPQGAAPCGAQLRLRLRGEHVSKAWLRLWWQNAESRLPMRRMGTELFECNLSLPGWPGLMWYYFIAEDDQGETWYLGNAQDGMGGVGEVSRDQPQGYQITVYDASATTPEIFSTCARLATSGTTPP